MEAQNIGFIGGGNMASAIIGGLEKAYQDIGIHVCDAVELVRDKHKNLNRQTYADITNLCQHSDVIVLAVKPQNFGDIMAELAAALNGQLVISILAGVTIKQIEAALPDQVHVVRTMPNTPMMIGQGMIGMARGTHADEKDISSTKDIFGISGKTLEIDESKMNALTAVSGSGPAYFFHFCEALQAAAESIGFSTEEAQLLVSQTAQGSVNYLCQQEGFPAAQLREQVTSKGGTTAAALDVFKSKDFIDMCQQALAAAEQRGKELAEQA